MFRVWDLDLAILVLFSVAYILKNIHCQIYCPTISWLFVSPDHCEKIADWSSELWLYNPGYRSIWKVHEMKIRKSSAFFIASFQVSHWCETIFASGPSVAWLSNGLTINLCKNVPCFVPELVIALQRNEVNPLGVRFCPNSPLVSPFYSKWFSELPWRISGVKARILAEKLMTLPTKTDLFSSYSCLFRDWKPPNAFKFSVRALFCAISRLFPAGHFKA